MLERWAEACTTRAVAYWTPERIRAQLGERSLILRPVEAAPLLRAMGLLMSDASMTPSTMRKFLQINHMVRLLRPFLLELAEERQRIQLLDAGCGSSYLTLLLGWCFKHIWNQPVSILGIDRNADIIHKCQRRAELVGLGDVVRFAAMHISQFDPSSLSSSHGLPDFQPDVLVSLHACDTATDDALALGIRTRAHFIAVAPCCQAELSRKLSKAERAGTDALTPLWRAPHLRREFAATMTDMMRTLLLRGCGYRVTPMEFVPSQHTPKNTMLRAVRSSPGDPDAFLEYCSMRRELGDVGILLEQLIPAAFQHAIFKGTDR